MLKGDTVEIDTAGYRQKQRTQIHATQLTTAEREVEWISVQKLLPEQYQAHWEVFTELAANRIPPAREEDHAIVLKEGAPTTIDCKVYHQTETELEAMKNFIQDSLAKGYITDSKSPYTSGLFYQVKADGKLCPIMLCKKESWLQSKKTDFSQEKSRKSHFFWLFLTFPWLFLTEICFFWL